LPSVPSLSGEILFKPSKTADEKKDAKGDEVINKREFDMPASQFLQQLQSSTEMKNCKYADSFCIYI
jgi:U3 small nucleolar RNA-associated protein 21